MVVGSINQDYLYRRASQAASRRQSSEASTDDYDFLSLVHYFFLFLSGPNRPIPRLGVSIRDVNWLYAVRTKQVVDPSGNS
jgi:hypothetical protein